MGHLTLLDRARSKAATPEFFQAFARPLLVGLVALYMLVNWWLPVAEFPDSTTYNLGGRSPVVALLFDALETPDAIKIGHAIVSLCAWAYFAYQTTRMIRGDLAVSPRHT